MSRVIGSQMLLFPEIELDIFERSNDQMLTKIVLRDCNGKRIEPIPAIKIIIPDFEGFDFYLHQDPFEGGDGVYCVSEPRTGALIACGNDPMEAVTETILTLSKLENHRQYQKLINMTVAETVKKEMRG